MWIVTIQIFETVQRFFSREDEIGENPVVIPQVKIKSPNRQ